VAAGADDRGFQPWFRTRLDGAFERLQPEPVGRFHRNQRGLYDVHGGVWELLYDDDGSLARAGGSWRSRWEHCSLDQARPIVHEGADPTLGLRPVIEADLSPFVGRLGPLDP
jgi:formylglycine-generating enzyme required for sulfatase activity